MPETPKLTDALPTGALKDAGQQLLGLVVQRAAEAASDRITALTDRLDGVTENGGTGLGAALRGRSRDDDGEDDENGGDENGGGGLLSGLKDTVTGMFGGGSGGGGGGKKLKVTQIVEDHDIGLPLRTTYNLWTQIADFPSFMKKVESVEQVSDEKSRWKAQVFLSHREWEATVVEQVPDSHIVWRSTGAKGHVDGAVTFTELGRNLTRVLLVLEYYPQGLFERTGNIWRAQGRRARLEFQHFKRHAMTNVLIRQDEVEGWRGEIRDSEVVRTHEEALEDEQREADVDSGVDSDVDSDVEDEYAEDDYEDDLEPEDEADVEPEDETEDEPEDEPEEEPEDEPVYEDEYDEDYEGPSDDDREERPRRREPARSGAGRGGDR
ncbi:SRPBCC family protein [Pseudonocardia sp. CA-107938]|uniref:SRPBCC family protein n=1 Tax=Pseudonocardia sp. CA-107938 TaxID=3240021 RepID=UPI003D916772